MYLEKIVGHSQPKKVLRNSISEGRVAHAYLFHGPAGVGKKALVKAFTASLMCGEGHGHACGSCSTCRRITEDIHPDFFIIQPMGNNIKIEQIREIQKKAQFKPYEASRKIFLIAEADSMTRDAANCLLKILEEPPTDTIFLLTATSPFALLPTIASRCQLISMGKVSLEEIETLLVENNIEHDRAKLFASLSDGIPGVALEMTKSDEWQEARNLVFILEEKIKKSDINELIKSAEELEKRKDLQEVLEQLLLWYRDRLIWAQTGDEQLVVNIDKLPMLKANYENKEYLVDSIQRILEARNKVRQNVNTKLTLEVLFLQLSEVEKK